jgi:hypothetical protein
MAWEVSGTTLAIRGALLPFASCNKGTARKTTRTCWTPPLNNLASSVCAFLVAVVSGQEQALRGKGRDWILTWSFSGEVDLREEKCEMNL